MQSQSTYNYTVVRQFAIMTVVWGIVGMLVGVLIAAQLIWPELNLAPCYDCVVKAYEIDQATKVIS